MNCKTYLKIKGEIEAKRFHHISGNYHGTPKHGSLTRLRGIFGTIHILCKHLFRFFLPPTDPLYIGTFLVLEIIKHCNFMTPPPASAYRVSHLD